MLLVRVRAAPLHCLFASLWICQEIAHRIRRNVFALLFVHLNHFDQFRSTYTSKWELFERLLSALPYTNPSSGKPCCYRLQMQRVSKRRHFGMRCHTGIFIYLITVSKTMREAGLKFCQLFANPVVSPGPIRLALPKYQRRTWFPFLSCAKTPDEHYRKTRPNKNIAILFSL